MDKKEETYIRFELESGDYFGLPTKKFLNRKPYTVPNPKQVLSFIPGIVRNVFIKPNHIVKEGDVLLELEAMKMYNKILAPKTGKIKHVNVKPGDKIPKNFILVEYD